jgi:integrase
MIQTAALRFLFLKVLKRRFSRDDLPLPRLLRRQVPIVLSRDEVARLIAAAGNLRHRTILMTLYSTGTRRSKLCHLRPEDIDQERRVIRIRQGQGGKDREVPLSPKLLDASISKPVHPHTLRRYAAWGIGATPESWRCYKRRKTSGKSPYGWGIVT